MASASPNSASPSDSTPATSPCEQPPPLTHLHHALLVRNPRFRAGSVIKSLLTTVCGGAMLMTAAAVLDPATLQAGSIAQNKPAIARDAHQEFVRSLSTLIAQSRQLLAANQPVEDRGTEIILWFEDTRDPGRINADELALLRHSPLFQTITVYTASKQASDFSHQASDIRQQDLKCPLPSAQCLSVQDIASPGFIDRWRAMSAVQAKVVATGISDLQVEAIGIRHQKSGTSASCPEPNACPHLSNLRLHLQWSGDSVDGGDEASAVIPIKASGIKQEALAG